MVAYIRAGYDEQTVEDRYEDTVTSGRDMMSRQWRIGMRILLHQGGRDMMSRQWRIGMRILLHHSRI